MHNETGLIDSFPLISTTIKARQLIRNIRQRMEDSTGYWDNSEGYNLRYARAQSFRMVIGKQIDISKLYRYQIPYIDNEIHIAVDAIISYVCSQQPRPEVLPSEDTPEARIIAQDLEKALVAHSEKVNLQRVFEQTVFNLLIKRVGIIKAYYDPDWGKEGEIRVETVNPDWVIVDKNVKEGENPAFIAEIHKDSVEGLIGRFPNKKDEILDTCSIKKGTIRQMSGEVVWHEVWATVYNKRNEAEEWVFCFINDVMLDMFKNPNWYWGVEGKYKNFLDAPMKPYIPLNYLNDGSHWIDQTTPVEQAYSMQDVLNKRGRQIMENADTANGFLVFAAEQVTRDDVEALTGDPNQKLTINTEGRPLSELVMQIQPHMLPNYVLDDKIDARSTIHSLIGTPSQFTGTNQSEAGKDQTLGEAIMIKNQAQGRQDRIVRAVERTAKTYFNFIIQLMAVHYTDKHWFVYNSGNGDFDRIVITRGMIDKGMEIQVGSGTTLPFDKAQRQNVAMALNKTDSISMLDLYKDLGMDNPQQRYDNWTKFKTAPQELARDSDNQLEDDEAYVEFIELMAGKKVEPKQDASVSHLLTHKKQMLTEKFIKADRKIQKRFMDNFEKELSIAELIQQLDQESQQGLQALDINAPIGMAGSPGQTMQPPGANVAPPTSAISMGALQQPMPPQAPPLNQLLQPTPQPQGLGMANPTPPLGGLPTPENPPNPSLSNLGNIQGL